MFPQALACDFDGTIASDDRIRPAAHAALERARRAGLRLVLVSGRTFFELTRVCDCLELFDVVVAENGGVLYYPGPAVLSDQGPPPPARLLAELDRRGVQYEVGRVIVGTSRSDEPDVRAALDATGITRAIAYNRAFLMLLPEGLDKASGVQGALRTLGLSFHDVVAFGDAENDLPLFEACGWSACPASAEAALREAADWVFPGEDGDSVAAAIAGPVLEGLPIHRSRRHRIALGWAGTTSEPVSIPARGVNVLIHGDSLSGKSWLAGALLERLMAARLAVCVIDPEGDYQGLARRSGARRIEVAACEDVRRAIACLEREPGAAVVVDFSALIHPRRLALVEEALSQLRGLRHRVGRPHWIVVDEAHYCAHEGGVSDDALGIADRGFCLITYRPSWLRDAVLAEVDVLISARTTDPVELALVGARYLRRARPAEDAPAALASLPAGEFVAIYPDADGGWTAATFVAAPRETPHVRHLKKYAGAGTAPERRFFFREPDGRVIGEAGSLHAFCRALPGIGDAAVAHHARCGDFSRWINGVYADRELAGHVRKAEQRWCRGEIRDLRAAIGRVIAARYGDDDGGAASG
jgi:hydroxymethylpyrimidine pyrophosphatase-like HAD family hydrolase